MKIKNVDVLVTKCDLKENKEGKAYILVDILSLEDGSLFNILHRTIEDFGKFKPMTKYKMDLSINSSKFGLSLSIDKIGEEKGGI